MKLRRRHYFINASFQGKYITVMIAISLLIFLTLGFLYFNALETQRKLLGLSKIMEQKAGELSASDLDFDEELEYKAWEKDRSKLIILAACLLGLVALLTALSIFITHRAAGPVYAISKFLENAAKGDWKSIRPLRKKDDFTILHDNLLILRESLKRENDEEIDGIKKALEAMRSGEDEGKMREAVEALQDLIEKKKNRFR